MRTLYLVQEINWAYDDQWHYEDGAIPRKAFASRDDAEAFRLLRENDSRESIVADEDEGYWSCNLEETFGSFGALTTLGDDEIDRRLLTLGLPEYVSESDAGPDGNSGWWRNLWAAVDTSEKRDAVWQLFDKVRFHEVVEVEAEL